jgi:hypothetical protein
MFVTVDLCSHMKQIFYVYANVFSTSNSITTNLLVGWIIIYFNSQSLRNLLYESSGHDSNTVVFLLNLNWNIIDLGESNFCWFWMSVIGMYTENYLNCKTMWQKCSLKRDCYTLQERMRTSCSKGTEYMLLRVRGEIVMPCQNQPYYSWFYGSTEVVGFCRSYILTIN